MSSISIPPRYDWELYLFKISKAICNFNSTTVRLGAVLRSTSGCTNVISIPPRYDWELFFYPQFQFHIQFQFHHGTIGRINKQIDEIISGKFQFHHGTIGSLFHLALSHYPFVFQFHHGTIGSSNLIALSKVVA